MVKLSDVYILIDKRKVSKFSGADWPESLSNEDKSAMTDNVL